jgi:GT2 family glycosyltransferase
MKIDCIIIADCKDIALHEMTLEAIESLKVPNLNLIWIEGNKDIKEATAYQKKPFNYNQCLQDAEPFLNPENDAVLIINNDIVALKGCIEKLYNKLIQWDSVSPKEPTLKWHNHIKADTEGYTRTHQVCGWALMFHKRILNRITWNQLFPIELKFWRQDQWYADMIKRAGYKHALIHDALLIHHESQSHHLLKNKTEYTTGQFVNYESLRSNL